MSNSEALADARAQGLYRTRNIIETLENNHIRCNGKLCLHFCSNDYLGLKQHPRLVRALQNGADTYGVGSGASHLIAGYSPAHRAAEEAFAEFLGHERALLFNNGYCANLGVVSALSTQQSMVYQDKMNHASLYDATRLSGARLFRYRHHDMTHLTQLLTQKNTQPGILISDGVFSMDGSIADVTTLQQHAHQHQMPLMIDDAHGLGILGKTGRGTLEHHGLAMRAADILVWPLGKAAGSFGAIVAAKTEIIEQLIQSARSYIYTTAMPAALACVAQESLLLMQQETWRREKLLTLIAHFQQGAQQRRLTVNHSHTPIQSIPLTNVAQANTLGAQLLDAGFYVFVARPPTVPAHAPRLRITLNCLHTSEEIDRLLDQMATLLC